MKKERSSLENFLARKRLLSKVKRYHSINYEGRDKWESFISRYGEKEDALSYAFVWDNQPEGTFFWTNLNDEFYALMN